MTEYIELPDGRLVCSAHRLVVCGKCCVDYSFMDEVLDDGKGESDGDEILTEEEMKAFKERLVARKGRFLSLLTTCYVLTDTRMRMPFAHLGIWM